MGLGSHGSHRSHGIALMMLNLTDAFCVCWVCHGSEGSAKGSVKWLENNGADFILFLRDEIGAFFVGGVG